MPWGSSHLFFKCFFMRRGVDSTDFLAYLETPLDFGANPGPLDHPWPQVHPWVTGGPGAGLEGYPPVPWDVKNHVFFVVELPVDDFHANISTHVHIYIYIYTCINIYIYTYTYLAANITAGPGSLHQPPRGSYRDATEAFHRRSGECHQPWPVGGQFECDFWGPANFNCSWPGAFAVEFCYKTSLIDLDPDRLTASYLDVWLHGTCRNLIARLWDCPGIEHRRGKSSMIASCINVHLVKVSCISTYFDPFVAITQTGSHDHHYKRQIPPSGRFCGRWTCCSQKIAIWGSFATQAWLRPIRRLYWRAIGYSGYRVSDVSTLLLLFCADWIRWLQRCLQNDVKASKSHEFQYHHDI